MKHLIGADSFMGSGDFSKDLLAQRRKGHLVTSKCLPRRPHGVIKTGCMIVLRCRKCIAHHVVHHGPSVTSAETTTSGLIGKFGRRLSGAATLQRVCQSKPLRWRNVDCQIYACDTLYHLMRDIVQHTLSPGCASVRGADHLSLSLHGRTFAMSSHAHSRWPRQT